MSALPGRKIPDWVQREATSDKGVPKGFVIYDSRRNEIVPRPYTPHGTFKALEAKGSLHTAERYKKKIAPAEKGKIPGYTGFIRGKQHLYGRSFGRLSRIAAETSNKEKLENPCVPMGPQYEIPSLKEDLNTARAKAYQVPGFSLNEREEGDLQTLQDMKRGSRIIGRRYRHTISSNPIPGQTNYETPRKVIPQTLQHVQYISK
mmetsp:Transcript_24346/g.43186  ORF Transcript_24346/g.43186 Transcript_24346/m.43186 type:complete len:204 (-) Transcript_24346:447-1058(-)|eukprot:CAMPEP_0197517778 /NCGR_PEP_ID=MMETSP1318-20131121/2853_1 /TAXON_ID=552666 /ORGANISM="Partenskyella glossopodia, Strain RCC365" /LENGTH=203 /DNA_ID=CAMNT_0043067621 /DNA_START=245 /DNA_END=856 /DNA_ORIENTATION=+